MPFKSISELGFSLPEWTWWLVWDLVLVDKWNSWTLELTCSQVWLSVTYIVDNSRPVFIECLSLRENSTCSHYAWDHVLCKLKRNPN